MSGLVARLSRFAQPTDREPLEAMLQSMEYRGAQRSIQLSNGCGLGACWHDRHVQGRALRQADGCMVAADARLDNREQLQGAGLLRQGERLEDVDDASLILRAYQRWGVDCPARLLGDFAFALWDEKTQQLLCARDPMGVRSLYYTEHDGWLVCATEPGALFFGAGIPKQPNVDSIMMYLSVDYAEQGDTLYENVRALAPAHTLVVSRERVERVRYWSPDPWRKLELRDEREYAQALAETFRDAVAARVNRNRGTTAVLLSGGLDSSSIACQAGALEAEVTAIRVRFPTLSCDETPYSQAVADMWRLPVVDFDATSAAALPLRMDHPDVPYHPTTMALGLLLNAAQREGVGTVLSGLSGDQWLHETGVECVDALRELGVVEAAAIAGVFRTPLSRAPYHRLWGSLKRLVPEPFRIMSHTWRSPRLVPPLSEEASRLALARADAERLARARRQRYPDALSRFLCEQLEAFATQIPLLDTERLAAQAGLEAAHPFMDRRIFELMLSMPRTVRMGDGVPKAKPLLRRAMGELLPVQVRTRKDGGEFSCYICHVFLNKHRRFLEDLVSSSRLAEIGLVERGQLRDALDSGFTNRIKPIYFGLFVSMELWLRHNWP